MTHELNPTHEAEAARASQKIKDYILRNILHLNPSGLDSADEDKEIKT